MQCSTTHLLCRYRLLAAVAAVCLALPIVAASADRQRTIQDPKSAPPVSFINDVVPVLTKAGCNAGACHGSQYGKGGFKLSLLGYDPEFDYKSIVKQARGRRLCRPEPEHSLVLLKP